MAVVTSAPLLPAEKGKDIQLHLAIQPQGYLLTGISM